jgi:glycosyl transferase family 61
MGPGFEARIAAQHERVRMSAPSLIVHTEPRCVTLRDAIATPFALVAPDQPPRLPGFKGYTRGCLYDSDGIRVELSVPAGDQEDPATSTVPQMLPEEQRGGSWLAGRTLFLGQFKARYGAFITETLSRYWLKDAGPFDHIVGYPSVEDGGEFQVQDFHRYLAGLLSVPIDRMLNLKGQLVFDQIVVPEQLWTSNVGVNAHMREVYGRIRDRHKSDKPTGRLFLSRAPSERLGNTQAVEEIFVGFGFRVIYPEQLPIAEQLSLYANCEVLASLSGGAMHNCVFARPGLMTIEVGDTRARRGPNFAQRAANELAQIEAHFIPFGEGTEPTINPKNVRKRLRTILGELERRGPVLLLRLKRKLQRLKDRSKLQADLRGGS